MVGKRKKGPMSKIFHSAKEGALTREESRDGRMGTGKALHNK